MFEVLSLLQLQQGHRHQTLLFLPRDPVLVWGDRRWWNLRRSRFWQSHHPLPLSPLWRALNRRDPKLLRLLTPLPFDAACAHRWMLRVWLLLLVRREVNLLPQHWLIHHLGWVIRCFDLIYVNIMSIVIVVPYQLETTPKYIYNIYIYFQHSLDKIDHLYLIPVLLPLAPTKVTPPANVSNTPGGDSVEMVSVIQIESNWSMTYSN